MHTDERVLTVRRIIGISIAVVILVLGFLSINNLFYNVDADELVVTQGFASGKMDCWTDAGYKLRKFAHVTVYKRSSPIWFGADGKGRPLPMRFNDAGKVEVYVSAQVFMPTGCEELKELRKVYGSQDSVIETLVARVVKKAVYNTGPLLSSRESFAEKRPNILQYIEDQANGGIYQTFVTEESSKDEKGEDDEEVDATESNFRSVQVEIVRDAAGLIVRKERSELEKYGVSLANVAIDEMEYEDATLNQINAQREAQQAIQTARAQAKEAQQKAITEKAQGEARAAKARADAEVQKAQAVVQAQQQKEVAVLEAEKNRDVAVLEKAAAEAYKQAQTLKGEGDAAYKRAVMQADGALEQKLATYERTTIGVAQALAKQQLVPGVVVGASGDSSSTSTGTLDAFLKAMTAKAAQDLALNPGISPNNN